MLLLGEVVDGEPEVAERQRVERRGEAIGDERQLAAVGRERRVQVGESVRREARLLARLHVVDPEIEQPACKGRERDAPAVWRHDGIAKLRELLEDDLLDAPALVRVEDQQRALAAHDGVLHEEPAVRAPAARRLDELQAVEMRVGRRRRQLVQHLAGVDIGQEEIDGEQVALGHVGDAAAVGRQGRRDVQFAASAGLVDDDAPEGGRRALPLEESRRTPCGCSRATPRTTARDPCRARCGWPVRRRPPSRPC